MYIAFDLFLLWSRLVDSEDSFIFERISKNQFGHLTNKPETYFYNLEPALLVDFDQIWRHVTRANFKTLKFFFVFCEILIFTRFNDVITVKNRPNLHNLP